MISVFGSKVGNEEIAGVTACMESQWMGFGKKVAEFEKKFCDHYSIQDFAMVDSGSNALYMACVLLDLPKGSEIILPSFTWVSCAQAIYMAGHKPVFCDVDLRSFNVTAELIKPRITKRTGAIMELGFPVIEDAAHAVNSTYYGKPCGAIADIGIYSFDAVKNLTTGEGGGITAADKNKIVRAKMLRYCGIGFSGFDAASANAQNRWWEYRIQEHFIKMLPTNIAASIGIAQLDKIDELQEYRKKIWAIYDHELSGVDGLICPPGAESHETHSYFTYVIRVKNRDELAKHLYDKGIYTTLRYHPLHLNPIFKSDSVLPNCEKLNEEALSIPLHPNLSMDDVNYILDMIKKFRRE